MTLADHMKLLAPLGPLLLAAIALALVKLKNMRTEAEIQGLELDAAKAAKLARVTKGAVYLAEETAAAGRRDGSIAVVDKAKLAADVVLDEFPDMNRDDADAAVRATVGELPHVGATGKNGRS